MPDFHAKPCPRIRFPLWHWRKLRGARYTGYIGVGPGVVQEMLRLRDGGGYCIVINPKPWHNKLLGLQR